MHKINKMNLVSCLALQKILTLKRPKAALSNGYSPIHWDLAEISIPKTEDEGRGLWDLYVS